METYAKLTMKDAMDQMRRKSESESKSIINNESESPNMQGYTIDWLTVLDFTKISCGLLLKAHRKSIKLGLLWKFATKIHSARNIKLTLAKTSQKIYCGNLQNRYGYCKSETLF